MSTDAISAFRAVIEAAGLRPDNILADGTLHRCPVEYKPQGRDGAYVLHLDAPASGWWQNYRTGEADTWTTKEERTLSPAERQALQARIEADRRARQEDDAKRQAEARDKARRILADATECTAHPYLECKGVKPCPGLKIGTDGRLVVPVLAPEDGKPMSLQTIAADGGKQFLPGGRIKGGYFAIKGSPSPERLCICEGLVTGLSIQEATGLTVLVAFDCGNLEHVAVHARQKYPDRELVLCADDDHATPGNPGVSKATAAALAVDALRAMPSFKVQLDAQGKARTDFNDLHQVEGLDVVRAQLAGASKPVAAHSSCETGGTAWELARELFPRIAFPWEVLPEAIAGSLKQLGRSCATSATPLPIQALCLIAAAIGRKVDVQAKESWREPLIFWAADIRDSGAGKTSPMWMLAEEVSRRQAKEHERFKADSDAWAKLELKDRKGMDSPRKARGYFATNMTLEGIHADLEEHQTGGLAVLLNELSAFIGGQNQYKSGGTDRESWLALHDGKDARISRAKGSVFIKGARVQVCGGIQPGIFRQVFGGEGGQYLEDGTVFRCLFTYEPACHHELTAEAWTGKNQQAWAHALANALDWADRQHDTWRLALSPEAQARFIDWRNALNAQVQDLPGRFRGFMPKAYGYALRLAGAIHMLERFGAGLNPEATLSIGDMERGILAVSFYLGQAVDALRLLVGEGDAVVPVEVSERSMLLARVLESLRGEVDNGRLAVGFIQEAFDRAARAEEQMHTARALGSLLRSCGLTAPATKHDANGKRRVCCLTWDTKTDSFIKQSLPSLPCLQNEEPQGLGDRDFTMCNVSKVSNPGDSPETLETLENQSLQSGAPVTVGLGDNGDIGDIARGISPGVPDRVTI